MKWWLFSVIASQFLLGLTGVSAWAEDVERAPLRFSEERIPLQLPSGRRLIASVRVPVVPENQALPWFKGRKGRVVAACSRTDAAKSERYAAMMIFGGFQNAARVLDLVAPDVPVVLASFDYPFDPPRRFEFPGSIRYAVDAKQMAHDTVDGIVALAQYLRTRADVDEEQITVVGASLGAPFAVWAAARDSTIRGLVVVHGFGDVPGTAMHQFVRAWEPRFGWLSRIPAWLISHLGWRYIDMEEPENVARAGLRPGQQVLMISASQDSFIPESARERLWRAFEESRALSHRLDMPGDHLQPGAEATIADILGMVRRWMQRQGLLAVHPKPQNAS